MFIFIPSMPFHFRKASRDYALHTLTSTRLLYNLSTRFVNNFRSILSRSVNPSGIRPRGGSCSRIALRCFQSFFVTIRSSDIVCCVRLRLLILHSFGFHPHFFLPVSASSASCSSILLRCDATTSLDDNAACAFIFVPSQCNYACLRQSCLRTKL